MKQVCRWCILDIVQYTPQTEQSLLICECDPKGQHIIHFIDQHAVIHNIASNIGC